MSNNKELVLDTNIWVDLITSKNLLDDKDDEMKFKERFNRAKDSLILALYLHKNKYTTYSYQNELTTTLPKISPPNSSDGVYTKNWIHNFLPIFFFNWVRNVHNPNDKSLPKSNNADEFIANMGKYHSCQIITAEVLKKGKSVPKSAKELRIKSFSPREFLNGKEVFSGSKKELKFIRKFTFDVNEYKKTITNLRLIEDCKCIILIANTLPDIAWNLIK